VTSSRSFAARLDDIASVVEWIRSDAGEELTSHERWDDFELAIVEAVTNTIVHALRDLPDETIGVELLRHGNDLVVTLTDRGRAMPASLLDDPVLPDPLATSGRGLWLIKHGADEVRYTSAANRNELRLTFKPAS
jgi:anti-sigma regulatory factor (Ser/Thr protein kinase)